VPLGFFRAINLGSAAGGWGKTEARELAYYITVGCFGRFVRGKIFLHVEMPSGICFQRPYLCKNQVLMEQVEAYGGFLLCFAGVFSRARNVLPSTFSKVKTQLTNLKADCGGRLTVTEHI
jgi:hypothetical protein